MLAVGLLCRNHSVLGLQKIERKDWWLFLLGGVFQPFLYFILETYSYDSFATPTLAEAFLSTNPLMAPLFAYIFLRERVTIYNILGILISTAGMLLLVLYGAGSVSLGNPIGIPLAILTVSTAVAYSIILKKIPNHYSSLTIVFWVFLFGLVLFYVLSALASVTPLIHVSTMDLFRVSADTSNVSSIWPSIGGLGYLAVLSSVAAFILFCYCVRYIGVTRANIFNNVRPVFTALLMFMLCHEHLPLMKWVGILIIIVGLFVSQVKTQKN